MTETIYVEGSGNECDVRIDTWLKDLLPRTPGIVRQVAKREVLLAIREFYEQSFAWRVTIGPKNVVAGKSTYNLSPYDAYSNIVGVLCVEFNGKGIKHYARRPPGIEDTAASTPTGFYVLSPDLVRLWPTPQVAMEDGLTIYAALTPKVSVQHVPRISATHHYDAILDGALGRILAHPAKPYSNTTLGEYHLQRFRDAIGKYKGAAIQGYNGSQSWSFPTFG